MSALKADALIKRCVTWHTAFLLSQQSVRTGNVVKEKLFLWAGVLLCLAYLLPNHYSPWLSFHQELATALAFAPLLAWACTRIAPIPAIAYGAAALALVPLIQLATGQLYFATDGWVPSLYLLGFALSAHAGALCTWPTTLSPPAQGRPPAEMLWTALLLAALLSAGLAFHQWLMPTYRGIYIAEMPPQSRPFGNLAQPNQLATLLLLGTVGLVYLWEARRLRALFAIAALFLLLWALVMTGSRSVLLALVWLLPAYALMHKRCHLRTTPVAVMAGVAFYFAMTWLWPLLDDWLLLNAGTNTALERMGSPGIRSVIWLSMLDAIGRAPWLGYGWGQISVAQSAVTLDHPPTHHWLESAHNLFLDLALWNGLPVALLVIAGLAHWFFHQVRRCNDPMKWATLLGIAVVFNHAMVEFPLNYAYFLLPVGFFMGTLSGPAMLPSTPRRFMLGARVARGAVMATGAVASALTVSVAIEYFPMEADWALMRYQEARIGNPEATEAPPALVLTGIQQFLRFSRSEAKPGMSAKQLETMRRNSERYAYAAPMFKYALALALNHQPENARTTLKKMCSMHPQSVCRSAKTHWEDLAKTRHPELANFNFPK